MRMHGNESELTLSAGVSSATETKNNRKGCMRIIIVALCHY
jgi:hypothetical protein